MVQTARVIILDTLGQPEYLPRYVPTPIAEHEITLSIFLALELTICSFITFHFKSASQSMVYMLDEST